MNDVKVFPKGKKYYDNYGSIFKHEAPRTEHTVSTIVPCSVCAYFHKGPQLAPEHMPGCLGSGAAEGGCARGLFVRDGSMDKPVWQAECEIAEERGWDAVPDKLRGNNWCRFVKGKELIWSVYPDWLRATLGRNPDDTYDMWMLHHRYPTLEAALAGRGGKPV